MDSFFAGGVTLVATLECLTVVVERVIPAILHAVSHFSEKHGQCPRITIFAMKIKLELQNIKCV